MGIVVEVLSELENFAITKEALEVSQLPRFCVILPLLQKYVVLFR